MNAGLGRRIAHHPDSLARTFARTCVCLGALPANRQAAQVPDTSIAFDGLQSLEIHTDLAPKIALDHILAILDRVNDLGKLLFGQILGANARIYVRLLEHDFGVARADAINVAQRDIYPLIRRHFHSDNTSHKLKQIPSVLPLPLLMPGVGADHTDDTLAANNFAIFAKLLN